MRSERSSGPRAAARAAVCAGSTRSPARRNEARSIVSTPAIVAAPAAVAASAATAPPAPSPAPAFRAQQHNARQGAGVLALQEGRVVDTQEAAHRHERGGPRGAQDVGRL